MDFLDPKKQRAHTYRLLIGYVLVGIALILTTIILLYQAYGFGIDKNGQIIQNGLVFVSSTPNPAKIFINGQQYKDDTNVRIPLPAGQYTFELQRNGYENWKRAITVEGGSVDRFDYPFLIPSKLQSSTYKEYAAKPRLVTESPDRRWLITQGGESLIRFAIHDLSKQKENDPGKEIVLPDSVATAAGNNAPGGWELVQWSSDNRHVLLKHAFQKDGQSSSEYILLDREDPAQSVNLTNSWGINPSKVQLKDRAYDSYFLFDETSHKLMTATLKTPEPKAFLDHVLAFKSYGDDIVLYATDKDVADNKVAVRWREGSDTHPIRTFDAGSNYLLDLTRYDGDWYVVAGSAAEGKAYVYRNPVDMLKTQDITVPVHVLKVADANHLEFSDNARFIMIEKDNHFAVYDAEYDKGYTYTAPLTLDAPQAFASWMDGHRLMYTSGGKVVIFDFDSINQRTLVLNEAGMLPVFDRDYEYLYTVAPSTKSGAPFVINKTPLRIPDDL